MRHRRGIWNAMWSDMFIETTFMRYRHDPGGLIGITLKKSTMQRWALKSPPVQSSSQKPF